MRARLLVGLSAAALLGSACNAIFGMSERELAPTSAGGSGGAVVTGGAAGTGGDSTGGAAGSGNSGGGGGSGGSTPTVCDGSKTAVAADNFDSGVKHPRWTDYGYLAYGTIEGVDGELVITPGGPQPLDALGSVTFGGYDFTDSSASVHVVEATGVSTGVFTYLGLWNSGNGIYLRKIGSELELVQMIDWTMAAVDSVPYYPTAHGYWQLRESDGTVYAEASEDGAAWQPLASLPYAPSVRHMHLDLGVGSDDAGVVVGRARFDDLNGGVTSERACAIGTMQDDFDDGVLGDGWQSDGGWGDRAISEHDGYLSLILTPQTSSARAVLESSWVYNLVGGSLMVEVDVTTVGEGGSYVALAAEAGDSDRLQLAYRDGQVWAEVESASGVDQLTSKAFDPELDRWWRISEEEGTVYWDTSPDAMAWSTLGVALTPSAFDRGAGEVIAALVLGSGSYVENDLEARFDNLNLVP